MDQPLMSWDMFSLLCPEAAWNYLTEMVMPGSFVTKFIGPNYTDQFWIWNGEVGAVFDDDFHTIEFLYINGEWEEK